MKQILNWRRWVLTILSIGCVIGFIMLCDETENTLTEFIEIRIYAFMLLFGCGYPLSKLAMKWEREGKIKL